ncbi:YbjQ family protein [Salidesulfovibrio onnuriiensis]|uniref:YbjQ family protein n=1 Tax=Salidesulfovibrio onnuriiensis TaxID=2583823 RepID=UPI0011C86DE7|nr:heavy metal-binding domain-containing protein [Salidesulfovibrio onnuriiensis]
MENGEFGLFSFFLENINLLFLLLFLVCGQIGERRHYRSILRRERELADLPTSTLKTVEFPEGRVLETRMVCGHAVLCADGFRRLLAFFRCLFGGPVRSFEALLDRARREAMLRMKEQAKGASMVLAVRVETPSITGIDNTYRWWGGIEVVVYGTAVTLRD